MDSGIFWIVMLLGGVIAIAMTAGRSEAQSKAKAAYQSSLLALTNDPTDPGLRQTTLELGRAYSRLTRNGRGVSMFDEVALSNDINAAAGGTTAIATPKVPQPAAALPDVADRMATLARLKDQGLISDEEYATKRQSVLDEV
jgi:hypothetical protein